MSKCKECKRDLTLIIENYPDLCWSCVMER
jgi:hypothetical protein